MYELHQVGENSFYIASPANMGVYRIAADAAVLIDSGNDKDAAKKALRRFEEQGWRLAAVFSTHSHADHIGGNKLLQERTGCPVYAPGIDCHFTRDPLLEPALLFAGCPPKALRGKFLMAQPSDASPLTEAALPAGLTALPLPGHSFDMVGFRTADDVVFLGDALVRQETLDKYHVSFLFDTAAYLETLEKLTRMKAACFVPSHADPTDDIAPLAEANHAKTREVLDFVRGALEQPRSFEDLLAALFTHYGLTMDFNQNVLVGSTLKSHLAYLLDQGEAAVAFVDNRLIWQRAAE